MTAAGTFTELVRAPIWRRWTAASFCARWPLTMTLVALVLAGDAATGSLAIGAQLAGVSTAVSGLAATLRGRRLDRGELNSGLRRATASAVVAIGAMAVAVASQAPLALLYLLAAGIGLTLAGVSGGFRTLLQAVVGERQLSRALTAEAVFAEVAFVTGPALAGLLAWWLGPTASLAVMATSAGLSWLLLRGLPELHPPEARPSRAAWRTPGTWPVYAIAGSVGVAIGMYEAALPVHLTTLGTDPAHTGSMLALLAVGAASGGIIALRRTDLAVRPRLLAALLLPILGLALVASTVPSSLALLGAALVLAGLPIAPLNALGSILLQHRVPAGRRSEGFALFLASVILGAGTGQLIAGFSVETLGPAPLMLVAGALPTAVAGIVMATVARDRLRRVPA